MLIIHNRVDLTNQLFKKPFAFESVPDTLHGRQELVQLPGEHQGVRAPAERQVQMPAHLLSACHSESLTTFIAPRSLSPSLPHPIPF